MSANEIFWKYFEVDLVFQADWYIILRTDYSRSYELDFSVENIGNTTKYKKFKRYQFKNFWNMVIINQFPLIPKQDLVSWWI